MAPDTMHAPEAPRGTARISMPASGLQVCARRSTRAVPRTVAVNPGASHAPAARRLRHRCGTASNTMPASARCTTASNTMPASARYTNGGLDPRPKAHAGGAAAARTMLASAQRRTRPEHGPALAHGVLTYGPRCAPVAPLPAVSSGIGTEPSLSLCPRATRPHTGVCVS